MTSTPFRITRLLACTMATLGLGWSTASQALPGGAEIEMKVLILTSQVDDPAQIGDAPQLEAAKAMFDNIGMPYEIYLYDDANPSLPVLESGIVAKYQGILLPISDSRLLNPFAGNPLAQTLARYQFKYGVRVASLYGWPDDGACLSAVGYRDTTESPLNATLTTTGKATFPYLRAGSASTTPLPINGAWTYFANAAAPLPSGTTVTPLLRAKASDGQTHTLIATCKFNNTAPLTGDNANREILMATFDNNPYLMHTVTLSHGLLNWLTKGIMLGQRRVYIDPQVDDLGLPNDRFPYDSTRGTWHDASTTPWTELGECPLGGTGATTGITPCTYRTTGSDLDKVVAWQNKVRTNTLNASAFRLSMAYNGAGFWKSYGGNGEYPADKASTQQTNENKLYDTLTPRVVALKDNFKWISHTYDHAGMDEMDYNQALNGEMIANHNVRNSMNLPNYDKAAMVTPVISGLYNANVLAALETFGLQYLVSDTSRPTPPVGAACEPGNWPLPAHNSGKANCVNPAIYEVPRHPTALYYNVSTPGEWVAEYNHFYGPNGILGNPWGKDLTYAEILDKSSDVLAANLLTYDARPLMFHGANLRAYDGTHSLLGDLMDATLAKYNKYYKNLPIRSPGLKETGDLMKRRQVYNESGVTGVLKPGTGIVLTATQTDGDAVVVPLTGLTFGSSTETYGGQVTSYITLNPANGYRVNVNSAPAW